jgi:3-oxoacyl-[acyl-carrier-protein] synthase II
MLALEPLERARARGAAILAVIEGEARFSVPAPAYDWPRTAPDALEPLRPLTGAGDIDLIAGGANSTRRLDACELDLFERLESAPPFVTSIKGAVGEFGGAGALTLAAACLALHHQAVPPLCALRTPEPATRLRLAPRQAESAPLRRALVCGLARGGAGVGVLLRRAA